MNKDILEYYHDNGLMPDWIYYQSNDKTAQENYDTQRSKILDHNLRRLNDVLLPNYKLIIHSEVKQK